MQETNKKFKLVSNKKTRTILPNMFTLVGVCIGLTSIKFAFDERFGLAIICIIVAGLIDVKPMQTPTNVNIFGKIVLVFLLETNLNFLSVCCICYLLAINVSPAIVF